MKQSPTVNLLILASALFALSTTCASAAAIDPIAELKTCARIEDSADRFSCYEALGKRVLGEETSVVETPQISEPPAAVVAVVAAAPVAEVAPEIPVADASPDRLPDELGGRDYEEEKVEDKVEGARGHVKSCRQASDGRWYFVFESGQVWKQSNNGQYRFENCDFDVSIKKDMFGYKMTIDGGRTLRVRRQK